jgi:Tfp pilus assembly protein PilX
MMARLRKIRSTTFNRATRRGTVLILMLVCLLLLTMTTGVLIRAALLNREHSRTALPQSQANWLAHAAAEAATVQLQADTNWAGATWTVAAEESGGTDPARVTAVVTQPADQPTSRLVSITVDYPPDVPQRVHLEQQIRVDLPAN